MNKTPRELETREEMELPDHWKPAELLPEPDKEPGMEYKWKRVSMLNNIDPRNISAFQREKWVPVPLIEQPKFQMLTDPNSRYKDQIEIGGYCSASAQKDTVSKRKNISTSKPNLKWRL